VEADWNYFKPTILCCILSVQKPIVLTVVGLPCQSKAEALDSAVSLLIEDTERQLPGFSGDFAHTTTTDELKDILALDPLEGTYVYPLPDYAGDPIPTPNELSEDGSLCLYEIEFQSRERSDVTVLGIVFSCDPEPNKSQDQFFEAEFDCQGSSGEETISVKLHKRQILDLTSLQPHEIDERIHWMKHFNRIVTQSDDGKE
jgi:hypothetical protein